MAIRDELKLFVEEFKKTNGRIPTQNEIVKGTGRAAATIKSYLAEDICSACNRRKFTKNH